MEESNTQPQTILETDLPVGPQAITAYSRLSYTMWYALGEFIDNSTQSRLNYGSVIDDVFKADGTPLVVEIEHDSTEERDHDQRQLDRHEQTKTHRRFAICVPGDG